MSQENNKSIFHTTALCIFMVFSRWALEQTGYALTTVAITNEIMLLYVGYRIFGRIWYNLKNQKIHDKIYRLQIDKYKRDIMFILIINVVFTIIYASMITKNFLPVYRKAGVINDSVSIVVFGLSLEEEWIAGVIEKIYRNKICL